MFTMNGLTGKATVLPVIPEAVVADLVGRFTNNIPEEEQTDLIRICFQVELAHWMFVDKYCTREGAQLKHLAHIPFHTFAVIMFKHTPSLKHHIPFMEYIISNFKDYKQKVPTCGGILMNHQMTQVLLVQGFGNSWGFPKGKINQEEQSHKCAIREVFEETGYNAADLINVDHYIENMTRDRKERLYIIVGVDLNYDFKPSTLYEIRSIAWFGLDELPESKRDVVVSKRGYNNGNFFTVFPFVRRLKKWIADKKSGANKIRNFESGPLLENHFPFPYPMGFRGGQIVDQNPGSNYYSPDQFFAQAAQRQKMEQEEQANLSFLGVTPKNDILVNNSFGIPVKNAGCDFTPSVSRNPKRRLFTECSTDGEGELTSDGSGSSNTSTIFMNGQGASAWLNFKLDIDEIMSPFRKQGSE